MTLASGDTSKAGLNLRPVGAAAVGHHPSTILQRSHTSTDTAGAGPSPQFAEEQAREARRRRLSEGMATSTAQQQQRSASGTTMTRRRRSVSRRRQSLSEQGGLSSPDSLALSPRTSSTSTTAPAATTQTSSTTTSKKSLPHYRPTHVSARTSLLSRDPEAPVSSSFTGFRNLAAIVLITGNLRLIIENYMKYGLIKSVYKLGLARADLQTAALLTAAIPCHLFFSLLVERFAITALRRAKLRSQVHHRKHLWRLFGALHMVNASLAFFITSYTVYYHVHNPLLGTLCEVHSIVLGLKVISYALTNRDLRDVYLTFKDGGDSNDKTAAAAQADLPPIPDIYKTVPYPTNLTLGNLVYFWWAPTLVYQPVYPRSPSIRPLFLLRQVLELLGTIVAIAFLWGQYAVPILESTLEHSRTTADWGLIGLGERLMKLATVSIVIWLLGFFALFQSSLNILAELMRFGDRQFYQDWWNAESVGAYWKLWNKPVNNYFVRHLYIPLLKLGWPQFASSTMVFVVSAVLHEVLVGIPTHNVIGAAFLSMIIQIPLIFATAPLEKMGSLGATVGNFIFWLSFFLGQPLGVILYYLAWNIKH